MPDSDRVAAKLAEIRDRHELARAEIAIAAGLGYDYRHAEEMQRDVPVLLAVAQAALAYHEPTTRGQVECISCLDAVGEGVEWPCPEYRDISSALLGKEAADG